jgi:hypothetical protein
MWDLFRAGVGAMQGAGLHGYVEFEEVSCRHVLTPPHTVGGREQCEIPRLPFGTLTLVPLGHKSVGRAFRTTEVHCTFERIGTVDIRIFTALLDAGFYTAFLRHADGSLKLILTIQGFDPDIGVLYGQLYGWLLRCMEVGLISGVVTLKKEDIAGYTVLGGPDECGLQKVVQPLSVIDACCLPRSGLGGDDRRSERGES